MEEIFFEQEGDDFTFPNSASAHVKEEGIWLTANGGVCPLTLGQARQLGQWLIENSKQDESKT